MDPTMVAVAVVALLRPFVAKSMESFAGKGGEAAWDSAGAVLKRLRDKFATSRDDASALDRFEEAPSVTQPFEDALIRRLKGDPALSRELAEVLESVRSTAPRIEVTQNIDDVQRLVGVRIRNVRGMSSVKVAQEVGNGGEVVGAEITDLG